MGRFFVNSEPCRALLTIFMINLPVLATLAVTVPQIFIEEFGGDETYVWYGAVGLLLYFTIGANYNMIRCETTDPGILPARIWPGYTDKKYAKPSGSSRDCYVQRWFVNQRNSPYLTSFTFCKSCQIWQPPRTNHCPIC